MDVDNSKLQWNVGRRTLTDLPYEVIEQILSCKEISHVDICRISEVCQKLYAATCSQGLWRNKFHQSWRSLSKLCDNISVDWKFLYQERCRYRRHVQKLIANMCQRARISCQIDVSLAQLKALSEEHMFASHFILNELDSVVHDGKRYSRLTTKFYGSKLLHFARQHYLKKVFKDFVANLENCYQPLEKGATVISQFCEPIRPILYADICKILDDIALQVKEAVKQDSPKHPVLQKELIPASTFLKESLWSAADSKIILTCLSSTMFHRLRFDCVEEGEDVLHSDYVAIDKVLENKAGIPLVISIIYASVAHRLGVLCELCHPKPVALLWLDNPLLDEANRYAFIDITRNGKISTVAGFSYTMKMTMNVATGFSPKLPLQVLKDMVKSFSHVENRNSNSSEDRVLCECRTLELDLILSPNQYAKLLLLVELYMQAGIRLFEVRDLLQQIGTIHEDLIIHRVEELRARLQNNISYLRLEFLTNPKPLQKKYRVLCPFVLFAVGMVMKHKRYDYACVIYGWHQICRASDSWIRQMRVLELPNKNKQPFYNVLVDDGTQRYAAQENLEICCTPRFVDHPEVGKYFDEFQNTHFVPNKMLREEYPEDNSARERILRKFFTSHEHSLFFPPHGNNL